MFGKPPSLAVSEGLGREINGPFAVQCLWTLYRIHAADSSVEQAETQSRILSPAACQVPLSLMELGIVWPWSSVVLVAARRNGDGESGPAYHCCGSEVRSDRSLQAWPEACLQASSLSLASTVITSKCNSLEPFRFYSMVIYKQLFLISELSIQSWSLLKFLQPHKPRVSLSLHSPRKLQGFRNRSSRIQHPLQLHSLRSWNKPLGHKARQSSTSGFIALETCIASCLPGTPPCILHPLSDQA